MLRNVICFQYFGSQHVVSYLYVSLFHSPNHDQFCTFTSHENILALAIKREHDHSNTPCLPMNSLFDISSGAQIGVRINLV